IRLKPITACSRWRITRTPKTCSFPVCSFPANFRRIGLSRNIRSDEFTVKSCKLKVSLFCLGLFNFQLSTCHSYPMTTLTDEAAALGLRLTPEQEAAFDLYARELAEWNTRVNLTAIVDPEGIRVRHFLDSLTVAKVAPMKAGTRVIDVGTGAG